MINMKAKVWFDLKSGVKRMACAFQINRKTKNRVYYSIEFFVYERISQVDLPVYLEIVKFSGEINE